jgi:hypothetical protein
MCGLHLSDLEHGAGAEPCENRTESSDSTTGKEFLINLIIVI